MKNAHTKEELRQRQALPLEAKVMMTENRIHEWQLSSELGYKTGVVSFSGGKDSTVILHIARKLYPDIPAVFSNTWLEYPEIQKFVKQFDNVKIVQPKMRFDEVISKYGYPLIGKEVAEAIYYARRIRSQSVSVERAASRKRAEMYGARTTDGFSRRVDSCKADETSKLEKTGNGGGGRTTLSRRVQREIAEQSSRDECPEPG